MEEKLIEFIKCNKFLYNKRDSRYKNVILRDEKFQELSKELNVPAEKLKNRWRTMRDKFYRVQKIYTASGSALSTPKKHWKWWDHLLFLQDVDNENRMTSGNYENIETEPDNVPDNSIDAEFSTSTSICSDTSPTESFLHEAQGDTSSSSTGRKRKKQGQDSLTSVHKSMNQFLERASSAISVSTPVPAAKTPTELFFAAVAKEVDEGNLTPEKLSILKIEVSKKIHELLYD